MNKTKTSYRRALLLGICGLVTFSFSSDARADQSKKILSELEARKQSLKLHSLQREPIPRPRGLEEFVSDERIAVALGKALFWDMQLGSDGVQACASCHFAAGADNRAINQIHPVNLLGDYPGDGFDIGSGPNYELRVSDFPTHVKSDPKDFASSIVRDSDDIVSSQGVHVGRSSEFIPDPQGFVLSEFNTRRVADRNSPTVINAVFNHRQFWDGRASNVFNGVNIRGDDDAGATVFVVEDGEVKPVKVRLENSSLASQALGPPESDFEMAEDGQSWVDISKRFQKITRGGHPGVNFRDAGQIQSLTRLRPLARQKVHPNDSVLGSMKNPFGDMGLEYANYLDMIRDAFHIKWWEPGNTTTVRFNEDGTKEVAPFSLESSTFDDVLIANFPLFFGIAIQMYESTLVSDQSPVDRYLEGEEDALTDSEKVGLFLAAGEAKCFLCHSGPNFSNASVASIERHGEVFQLGGTLLDRGFHNLGLRDAQEDLGVWGSKEGNNFSFARKELQAWASKEPKPRLAAAGAFKTPTLRNVALTAPYFHNGSRMSLEEVVEFYFRGGDFRTLDSSRGNPVVGLNEDGTAMVDLIGLPVLWGPHHQGGMELDEVDRDNIVAFLKALTDPRVRDRKAPFDHPQLFIPNGHLGDEHYTYGDMLGRAFDRIIEIEAVGAQGGAALPTFESQLR